MIMISPNSSRRGGSHMHVCNAAQKIEVQAAR
jgi:hypothetical protein